jgi:acetyl esterase/lipase
MKKPALSVLRILPVLLAALVSLALVSGAKCLAQTAKWLPAPGHTTLNLWPKSAPDPVPTDGPEELTWTPKDKPIAERPVALLHNVTVPSITLYSPKGKNTGAAVVVFPGGGYNILAIDLEGTEVCDWLNSAGITCVLVKYRVPNTGPYPKSPAALEDAQRAVSMARSHAAEWHIDPNRIGVLGFSAGAHLIVALSTHFDKRLYAPIDAVDQVSCRPDFAVVVYPGYLADETSDFTAKLDIHPTEKTPPTFIVQAENDGAHVENSTTYFLALKKVKVPAELHIYSEGGHGYGLRRTALPVTTWPQLVEVWLRTIHVLSTTKP